MKNNIKLYLAMFSLIFILGLGFFFFASKNIDDKELANSSQSSGEVAGVNSGSTDDYITRLAKELADQGAIFYGSKESAETKSQKELFGESAVYLDYVECDISGADANPDECLAQNVSTYPTWLFNGVQYVGVQSLGDLAKIINFGQ